MKSYSNLSNHDKKALLKFPAYITLLAANSDAVFDDKEKISAIQLMHTKTYSSHPLLAQFYFDVDKDFKNTLERLNAILPKNKEDRDLAIKSELMKIEAILSKLSDAYGLVMRDSVLSFIEHVSKAHHNALFDFIFPIPILGITE